MSAELSGQAAVAVPSTNLRVDAHTNGSGRTVCKLDCNGQRAKVIFTGTEILFDVVEPAAPAEESP